MSLRSSGASAVEAGDATAAVLTAAALGAEVGEDVDAVEAGDEAAAVLTAATLCVGLDDGGADVTVTGTGATEAAAAVTTVTGPLTGASPDAPHPASNNPAESVMSNPKCLTAMPHHPSLRRDRRTAKVWTLS